MSTLKVGAIQSTAGNAAVTVAANGNLTIPGATNISNTATFNSEGGAVNQNLITGVNKQWINYSMHDASIRDSFNTTSITDNTTGDFSITIANNMANTTYVTAVDGNYNLANGNYTAGSANGLEIYRQMTTTAYDHIAASSGSTYDFKWVLSCNLGDLA